MAFSDFPRCQDGDHCPTFDRDMKIIFSVIALVIVVVNALVLTDWSYRNADIVSWILFGLMVSAISIFLFLGINSDRQRKKQFSDYEEAVSQCSFETLVEAANYALELTGYERRVLVKVLNETRSGWSEHVDDKAITVLSND